LFFFCIIAFHLASVLSSLSFVLVLIEAIILSMYASIPPDEGATFFSAFSVLLRKRGRIWVVRLPSEPGGGDPIWHGPVPFLVV
jgi:hypothetical protein